MLMRCPSGSALATYLAATTPPAPSRFSTMTGTPRPAAIFSARTRAIVSEAAPGVTPETRRMVLLGKFWASADSAKAEPRRNNDNALNFISSSFQLRQAELRRQPVGGAAAGAVRAVRGLCAAAPR